MIKKRTKGPKEKKSTHINSVIGRLSILQMFKLANRYGITPEYKNPQNRKKVLQRCLKGYWVKNTKANECAICLEQISFKTVIVTPCAHLFCDVCILPNLCRSQNCPICRTWLSFSYMFGQISRDRIPSLYSHWKVFKTTTQMNVLFQNIGVANMVEEEAEAEVNIRNNWFTLIHRQNIGAYFRYIIMLINILSLLITCHIGITFLLDHYYYLVFHFPYTHYDERYYSLE